MGEAAASGADHLAIAYTPAMAEVFSEVYDNLTDVGKRRFRDDVTQATLRTLRTGQSRHLNDVLQAWYRTLLLKRAGADDAVAQVADVEPPEDELLTAADVRTYLQS